MPRKNPAQQYAERARSITGMSTPPFSGTPAPVGLGEATARIAETLPKIAAAKAKVQERRKRKK